MHILQNSALFAELMKLQETEKKEFPRRFCPKNKTSQSAKTLALSQTNLLFPRILNRIVFMTHAKML